MGVDILETEDEDGIDENNVQSKKSVALAGKIARERGRYKDRVKILVGDGNPKMQKVRAEMFP